MAAERRLDDLTVRLTHLASSLHALAISVDGDGGQLSSRRDWIVRTIEDYVIPRLENPAAPLSVVFAGPTGAGKSTMLNSVAGAEHSPAGLLRPTTKAPLVLASGDHAAGLHTIAGIECQVVAGRAPILDQLTLIDTPDIDSTSMEHRAIAERMIDDADIVVYVNSALRYADLVPWEVLRRAHSRGAPVIHVLNRVKSAHGGALAAYSARLDAEGLGSDVVVVQEHHMAQGVQAVPARMVRGLRDRLVAIVEERLAGTADVVRSVLDTMLDHADEVISGVSALREDAMAAIAIAAFAVDLDAITAATEPDPSATLDLVPLAGLAGKRIWTRGRARRRLPAPESVARSQILTDAWLIAAVDADMREMLMRAGSIDRVSADELLADAHVSVVSAIAAWHRDLDKMQVVADAVDPALAAWLLEVSSIHGLDATAQAAMTALVDVSDLAGPTTRARELLELQLMPIYADLEYLTTARVEALLTSDSVIYRARTSLSSVVARSSFADA